MIKICIFIDWFTPAYKAGGPIRSCLNLSRLIQNEAKVFIVTSSYDLGGDRLDVEADTWIDFDVNVKVFYGQYKNLKPQNILSVINLVKPEVIYLNGMFSKTFTLIPLWLKFLRRYNSRIILAPRGMLQMGALQYKTKKKMFFLTFLKITGLFKPVIFHATDHQEKKDIFHHLKIPEERIVVIPNATITPSSTYTEIKKKNNYLKLVFVSRISPKKNLFYLLNILPSIRDDASLILTVIGENEGEYWDSCEKIISAYKDNIKVNYLGPLQPEEVMIKLKENHFFILPTHGENFGHAIFESFAVGRPVLISDQTPWTGLEEKRIGFDLPLENKDTWIDALNRIIQMEQKEYDQWCQNALDYAHEFVETSNLKERYLQLFS